MGGELFSSKYEAVIWVTAYLLLLAIWLSMQQARLKGLFERIRIEDSGLWRELGCPRSLREVGNWSGRLKFRRLKVDEVYARRFNPHVIARIRELQRQMTAGLVVFGVAGCIVLYLVCIRP